MKRQAAVSIECVWSESGLWAQFWLSSVIGRDEVRKLASKFAPTKRKNAVRNRTYQIGAVRLETALTVVGERCHWNEINTGSTSRVS